MKRFDLVIFDLDGTLVDSERLCNQALLDLIPPLRADTSLDGLVQRYRGQKLATILADIQRKCRGNDVRRREVYGLSGDVGTSESAGSPGA